MKIPATKRFNTGRFFALYSVCPLLTIFRDIRLVQVISKGGSHDDLLA
jgi:hypothetical protein